MTVASFISPAIHSLDCYVDFCDFINSSTHRYGPWHMAWIFRHWITSFLRLIKSVKIHSISLQHVTDLWMNEPRLSACHFDEYHRVCGFSMRKASVAGWGWRKGRRREPERGRGVGRGREAFWACKGVARWKKIMYITLGLRKIKCFVW